MGKSHYNISCHPDVWEKAQKLFPRQISGLIQDYLIQLINKDTCNIDGINLEMVKLQLNKDLDALNEIKANINEGQILLQKFKEKQDKSKQEELEKEKKQIEKMKCCDLCNNTIVGKIFSIRGKKLCKACFMA